MENKNILIGIGIIILALVIGNYFGFFAISEAGWTSYTSNDAFTDLSSPIRTPTYSTPSTNLAYTSKFWNFGFNGEGQTSFTGGDNSITISCTRNAVTGGNDCWGAGITFNENIKGKFVKIDYSYSGTTPLYGQGASSGIIEIAPSTNPDESTMFINGQQKGILTANNGVITFGIGSSNSVVVSCGIDCQTSYFSLTLSNPRYKDKCTEGDIFLINDAYYICHNAAYSPVTSFVVLTPEEQQDLIDNINNLNASIQEKIDTIASLTNTLEGQIFILNNLNASIQEKAQLISQLQSDIDNQAILIQNLNANLAEKTQLVASLTSNINEQAEIIRNLQLTSAQQAIMIANLTSNIQEQAQMINQLTENLQIKAELVNQLQATNENQARLIAEMRLSFADQAAIIENLDKTIKDDAEIISNLNINLGEQAEIISNLNLTNQELADLVKSLNLNLEDNAKLISELNTTIEQDAIIIRNLNLALQDEAVLINKLDLKIEEQGRLISELRLSLTEEQNLINKLYYTIDEQQKLLDETNKAKSPSKLWIWILGIGAVVIAIAYYRKK